MQENNVTEKRLWLMAQQRTEICGLNVTCGKVMNLSNFHLKCLISLQFLGISTPFRNEASSHALLAFWPNTSI